uniref:Uncharacterized protein n=1 Tax=Anguilla anguilla TaxID=7936 RepID=A0A0E9UG53_ANGAN
MEALALPPKVTGALIETTGPDYFPPPSPTLSTPAGVLNICR